MRKSLSSPPLKRLYKKFDKTLSATAREKFVKIAHSLSKIPSLSPNNFHDTLQAGVEEEFQPKSQEEVNILKFIAWNKWNEYQKADEGQLKNLDLQNVLQKQQQTMQMLSNVSNVLHDTSMAVIRKIG
jgi:hypothetical protein